MIAPASLRSRISAEPASPLTTFFTGQPMLMSMIAAPRSSLSFAASAISVGEQPASCIETGSSLGSQTIFCKRLAGFADRRLAGDHLGDGEPGAIALDDPPERHVGDARHRRQDHRRLDPDRTDLDGLQAAHGPREIGRKALAGKAAAPLGAPT